MGRIEPNPQSRDANLRRIRHLTAAAGALAASATAAFGILAETGAGHLAGAKVSGTRPAAVIVPAAASGDVAAPDGGASQNATRDEGPTAPATTPPATAAPATTHTTPASQAPSAPVASGSAPVAVSGGS